MPKYKNMLTSKYHKKESKVEELIVQKSNPLRILSETDMTLAEFKILDVYLGKINSRDPQNREVVFTKGELEQLLGVTKINKSDLKQRINNLGRMVEISDSEDLSRLKMISLFEKVNAWKYEDGLWKTTLKCTRSAMQYIFNIDNVGYIRYGLQNILTLTSRYSYVLFLYLEQNRFRKTWRVGVNSLKKILNCNKKAYSKYYRFNQLILTPAQKELHKKTNIGFEYRGIRFGKSTKLIEFTITKLPEELKDYKLNELCLDAADMTEKFGGDLQYFYGQKNNITGSNITEKMGDKKKETDTDCLLDNESENQNFGQEINDKSKCYINKFNGAIENIHTKNDGAAKCVNLKRKSLADIKREVMESVQEDSLLAEIKEQFKYKELVTNYLEYKPHIDFIFQILCDTIGTSCPMIKIKGVDHAAVLVKARFLKLKSEEIVYAAQKYSGLENIKNPEAFMTTMLYGIVGMPLPALKQRPKTSYNLEAWLKSNSVTALGNY